MMTKIFKFGVSLRNVCNIRVTLKTCGAIGKKNPSDFNVEEDPKAFRMPSTLMN